jgi:multidrug resistance efflux pump
MKKILIGLVITLILAGGATFGGFLLWERAGYLTTDNARVTTTLLSVSPTMHGSLERFDIYEGRFVSANEVLGWVENDAVMRSPVDGMVVHTSAQMGHIVSPMESIAVIADASNIHILANIEETDIMDLQLGQPAIVTIDVFGNREFAGYISEIGRITTAELSGQAMFF